MRMLKILAVAIALLPISQGASAQGPECNNADYDAARDFSVQSNPNGVWSYGWESTIKGALNLYTLADTNCYPGYELGEWHVPGSCFPFVLRPNTNKQVCLLDACLPPTYLDLHPGPTGQVTVVRWTAPSAGLFGIRGAVEGLSWAGPTSTDFYAIYNSKIFMVRATIDSYKSPLIFHHRRRVAAGDTIDFVVDWGKNHNYYCDSTGIQFMVTFLGP